MRLNYVCHSRLQAISPPRDTERQSPFLTQVPDNAELSLLDKKRDSEQCLLNGCMPRDSPRLMRPSPSWQVRSPSSTQAWRSADLVGQLHHEGMPGLKAQSSRSPVCEDPRGHGSSSVGSRPLPSRLFDSERTEIRGSKDPMNTRILQTWFLESPLSWALDPWCRILVPILPGAK